MGRHQEAIVETRKAESLDPADLGIGADAGWVLNYAHLYDQAIAEELKILEMEPGFALAHLRLGESYTQKGLYKEICPRGDGIPRPSSPTPTRAWGERPKLGRSSTS
jgi:tetratricopeptide (TPR) repeat protein